MCLKQGDMKACIISGSRFSQKGLVSAKVLDTPFRADYSDRKRQKLTESQLAQERGSVFRQKLLFLIDNHVGAIIKINHQSLHNWLLFFIAIIAAFTVSVPFTAYIWKSDTCRNGSYSSLSSRYFKSLKDASIYEMTLPLPCLFLREGMR
jgi:hypothetical protein